MTRKTNFMLGIILVLTLILTNLVFAFSVASSYWQGNPLTASQGETKTVNVMRLQNTGESDETVRAEITKGEDIASLEETDYLLKAKTENNPVLIKIKIPSDTAINTTYPVTVSFKPIVSGGAGGVSLGTGYDTSFDVLVTAKQKTEKPTNTLILALIAGIIIIIIIIAIVLKKRKAR